MQVRELARVGGSPPKWMNKGTSQSALRRQLWKMEEATVQVDMKLSKVWDTSTERSRVQEGGVWPVEASCVVLEEGQRWLLDALPAELSEQVFMQLREVGLEHSQGGQQEWSCSRWKPGALEEQEQVVSWKGESWSQQGAEECFAPGAELQLLGEGLGKDMTACVVMRSGGRSWPKQQRATVWGAGCLLRWWCRWSRHV